MATPDPVDMLHRQVKAQIKAGKTDRSIIDALSRQGIDPAYARTVIDSVYEEISDHKNFWKLFAAGLFFLLGGLAINYYSYRMAVNASAGFYYIFWGIVVFGVTLMIRAFIIFRR